MSWIIIYEEANQLYKPVKTEGETNCLSCSAISCDGSAKLVGDQFCLGANSLGKLKLCLVWFSTMNKTSTCFTLCSNSPVTVVAFL